MFIIQFEHCVFFQELIQRIRSVTPRTNRYQKQVLNAVYFVEFLGEPGGQINRCDGNQSASVEGFCQFLDIRNCILKRLCLEIEVTKITAKAT